MDRPYVAENDAARKRLRALVARLSDDDLRKPIGHPPALSIAERVVRWKRG